MRWFGRRSRDLAWGAALAAVAACGEGSTSSNGRATGGSSGHAGAQGGHGASASGTSGTSAAGSHQAGASGDGARGGRPDHGDAGTSDGGDDDGPGAAHGGSSASGGAPNHEQGGTSTAPGGAAGDDSGASGSSGAGAAGAGGSEPTPPLISLVDLTIDANPNMSISCYVSWHTDVPATSRVDFGEGSYSFRIDDDSLVTEHRVLVIGMHASTDYLIKAVSSANTGTGSALGSFTTGALPADFPLPDLTANDLSHSQVGWTLMNVQVGTTVPPRIVMYDEAGLPVWYFIQGTHADDRGDIATELHDGRVLVGPGPSEPARVVKLSGEIEWEGPANVLSHEQTHEFHELSNGNYLYSVETPPDPSITPKIRDQILEELTPDFSVAWSWRFLEHVPRVGSRLELCHGNALFVNEATNKAYFNCRFLGIFKIDRASGDIEWRLGGTFDTTSLGPGDFSYDPPASKFSDVHDPEFHSDGTLLVYDNGGYGNLPPGSEYHSRVLEYQLDEAQKTATRTFEFPGSFAVDDWYKEDWYTPIWGDANRLANGNILITAGTRQPNARTRIIEITRSGQVVWELTFPSNVGSYRANRLSPPPLVERIE